MLVWCVAVSLMIISVVEIGLYLAECLVPKPPLPVKIFPLVLKSIPFLLGVVMLIRAKALAAWVSEKLE